MEPVERMMSLTRCLPNSDIVLAQGFIDSRDFESLQELVDSAIVKARKSLNSDNPKEEYLGLDMGELVKLKAEVDVYIERLQMPYQYDAEEFEDYAEEY